MTVRLTPIESESTPSAPVPAPSLPSELPVTDTGAVAPVAGADGAADGDRSTDSRIALREARRARRRTTWLCAAVVALALALTIVVVSLARDRPVPSSAPGTVATLSAPSTAATGGSPPPSDPSPGAAAPEGGNP